MASCRATWRNRIIGLLTLVLAVGVMLCAPAGASVTVGLYFVEGSAEPIDFLTFPGSPPAQFIQPWQMTASGNQFVADGAFAGVSEADERWAIVLAVRQMFYQVPTPAGYVLDIDFSDQKVSGTGTVNVLLGKHNISTATWFGNAMVGAGTGNINGESDAAVSIDRIDSMLQVDFTHFTDAVNAVANVTAHEIGHLFWLQHVWADARTDLGWQPGYPVVANPYDVMATAPTGLPDSGWIANNAFSSVTGTQTGGNSSASLLIQNIGLRRQGDFDSDHTIGNSDIGVVFGNFGMTGAWYANGDTDADGTVGNSDIGVVFGGFGTSNAGNLTDSGTLADLIYDPITGNVTLDASESSGSVITNYVLRNAAGTFIPANFTAVLPGAFDTKTGLEISESDGSGVGVSGLLDLGNIFPTGMTLTQLESYLTKATYVGQLGSGVQTLDLTLAAAVPEPATLGLMTIGGLMLIRRRRMAQTS